MFIMLKLYLKNILIYEPRNYEFYLLNVCRLATLGKMKFHLFISLGANEILKENKIFYTNTALFNAHTHTVC